MEDTELSTIHSNLPFLLNNTECSVELLSWLHEILSDYELQKIQTEKTKQEKAYQLYATIKTKVGGYEQILLGLIKTKQTKVAETLINSIIKERISSFTVNIPGKNGMVKHFLTENELQDCVASVRQNLLKSDLYEVYKSFLSMETKIQLRDTIPPSPQYYIPRNLYARRAVLDPKVFRVQCQDVFVFKCSQPAQLVTMLNNQPVTSSEKQLVNVTARFILLKEEADWKIILKNSEFPTHLVRYEFDDRKHSLVLEDTTAGSSVVHKFLKHQPNDIDATIPEQEFIETALLTKGSGICICDKPGMGKSFLLANLARNAQNLFPEKFVIFFQFSEISGKISRWSEAVNDFFFVDLILRSLSENSTSSFFLGKMFKLGETPIELFFDGFDEIQRNHLQSAKFFLSKLSKIPNTRLYVTSRINTRTDLEESLGVMAYDIQPFTDSNQQEFLTTYWKRNYPANDIHRIKQYAILCLKEVNKNLDERDRDIAGVPLICRLVAEVYSNNASIFSQPERTGAVKMEMLDHSTLSQIYAKYMNRQLGATLCDFECLFMLKVSFIDSFIGKRRTRCNEKCMQKSNHAWIAVQTVFPDLAKSLERFVVQMSVNESLLSAGLLKKGSGSLAHLSDLRFEHRSFAEYLAVEFILKFRFLSPINRVTKEIRVILADFTLFNLLRASKHAQNIVKDRLKSCQLSAFDQGDEMFENGVCVYFYEAIFLSRPGSFLIVANELSFPALIFSDAVQSILLACIVMNYEKIFSLVINLMTERLLSNPRKKSFYICSAIQLMAYPYSQLAVKQGNVRIVEQLLSFLHNTLKIDCKNLNSSFHNWTSLDLAVRSEDIELVQCVSKFWSYYDADLINSCIKMNKAGYRYLDHLRLNLCGIVISQSMSTDIRTDSISQLDVIKGILILNMGKSLCYVYSNGMRYFVCDKLSACEYLELEKFVWKTRKVDISFKTNHEMPFSAAVLYSRSNEFRSKLEELLSLYDKPVPVHRILTNTFHNPLGRWSDGKMIELYWDNSDIEKGRTAIHLVAIDGDVDYLEDLICLGLSPSSQDEDGNTPLHLAAQKERVKMLKVLIKSGCDMHMRNGEGRTFIQEAATWKNSVTFHADQEFFELVVFLKNFVGEDRFREKDGIFREGLIARYKSELPENVNQLFYWDKSGVKKGRTALHLAATNSHVNIKTVECLLSLGLSTNCKDEDGNTPLHLATQKQHVEVMKVLIKSGCDMHLRNRRGRTFIQEAATWKNDQYFYSDDEFFKLAVLLKDFVGADRFREKDGIFMEGLVARYGANLSENVNQLLYRDNSGTEKGRTVLHLAAKYGHFRTVEFLISLVLSTNSQDENGNTALHLATKYGKVEVMKVLIISGCDMHLRNRRGRTFIQEAAIWKNSVYFNGDKKFFELAVFLRDFVGEDCFVEKNGIFMEGLVARYRWLPGKLEQLLLEVKQHSSVLKIKPTKTGAFSVALSNNLFLGFNKVELFTHLM